MLQGIVKLPRFQTGVFMGTLVYSGEWVDGQWGGEGKIVYPDGTSYSGQVEAALYHGYGYKQEYANPMHLLSSLASGKQHTRMDLFTKASGIGVTSRVMVP